MIHFWIICVSHSSVNEHSSLPVYHTGLMGKKLLKFQSTMQPPPKGKGITMRVMRAYGELEVLLHSFRTSILEGLEWSVLCPDISNPGKDPPSTY
jgi:hypothetical protein